MQKMPEYVLPNSNVNDTGAFAYDQQPLEQNTRPTPFDYFRKPPQPDHLVGNLLQNTPPQAKSSNVMAYFQDENGEFDLNKMFATTNQVSSMFKRAAPIVTRIAFAVKQLTS